MVLTKSLTSLFFSSNDIERAIFLFIVDDKPKSKIAKIVMFLIVRKEKNLLQVTTIQILPVGHAKSLSVALAPTKFGKEYGIMKYFINLNLSYQV